jgi:16S rRNA (uracil1498-N3)-methyltransferase
VATARHRFYLPGALHPGAECVFSAAQAAQIARVLRLRTGDEVEVFDGVGGAAVVELRSVTARGVSGLVGEPRVQPWPFPWRVTLNLALVRPQRFEWAIEKAVELGVWAVQPLRTERTQHGGEIGASRGARWQTIAIEAAEQCGSAYLPDVRAPLPLAEALRVSATLRLLPHTDRDQPRDSVAGALTRAALSPGADIAVFIGPEGGFTPAEVALAQAADCRMVTLGPLTLRSETAALAALALLAGRPALL